MSVINTNITSMIGQQNLNKSQNALTTSMERLSSGLRINSAKDDAAGQAIANRFSAQITGLNQASRNANDGISIAQTAEGSLNQINDNLQRIRELSVQAANGTNSATDRQSIQDEVDQRLAEINRISEETDFNGIRVLSEDAETLSIQVGANDGQTIDINLRTINAEALGLDDFDVRSAVEVQTGDEVTRTNELNTTDVADLSFSAEAGDITVSAAAGVGVGAISAGTGATVQGLVNSGGGTTYAQVEFAGTSNGGTAITETGFIALSTSDIAADGTFSFDNTATVVSAGTVGATTAADSFDYTVTLSTTGISGTNDVQSFVQDEQGNLFVRDATTSGSVVELYAVSAGDIGRDNGQITLDTATVDADAVSREIDASALEGTLREVQDADGAGTGTFVDDRGEDGLFLVGIDEDTGVATVQQAEYTDEAGATQNVDIQFGGVDGETRFASVEIDGETQSFAVTGDATNGYEVDIEGGPIAVDATENPLAALDAALQDIDNLRSELGAVQNRFEDAITNLDTNSTNLSAARSRIEDADYAMEVADMTRAQILQQAGTSVLAQANQIPQNVLSLLG